MFKFEEKFVHEATKIWMQRNWTNCFYYCLIYICLIFSMQYYMQGRPRFNLRKILILWNTALASFSIMGAVRTLPELTSVLKNYGIYHSVCIPRYLLFKLFNCTIKLH